MHKAIVVADSISPDGCRLTSVAAPMPRIVLAEQNTHRDFSRNAASSRAIPISTRCDMIEKDPFVPEVFGKNQRGMQATENLDPEANAEAEMVWREALSDALRHARRLEKIKVHKEYANRIPECFAWVTQLVSSTHWDNYMNLRAHTDAQPEIQKVAESIREAIQASTPREVKVGGYHLPFVTDDELAGGIPMDHLLKASVARSAAISFERHLVSKPLVQEIERSDGLLVSGHMSPFEHQAKVADEEEILEYASFRWDKQERKFVAKTIGNFRTPWLQYRKQFPGEDVFGSVRP